MGRSNGSDPGAPRPPRADHELPASALVRTAPSAPTATHDVALGQLVPARSSEPIVVPPPTGGPPQRVMRLLAAASKPLLVQVAPLSALLMITPLLPTA